jgi:hypothetical protein
MFITKGRFTVQRFKGQTEDRNAKTPPLKMRSGVYFTNISRLIADKWALILDVFQETFAI